RFLHEHVSDSQEIDSLSISTLVELVRLFLDNQYIVYGYKLYRHVRGSPVKSPLTSVLANIYMYYWEQELIATLRDQQEIYGRRLDQIFLTWNKSEEALHQLIETINTASNRYHFHLTITINKNNITYLDVNMSHIGRRLRTTVAHNITTHPYALPYVYGHRTSRVLTLLRSCLMRAALCCSEFYDFINECHDIQVSFEYNGFHYDYFPKGLALFLHDFHVDELRLDLNEAVYNSRLYVQLRQNIFQAIHEPPTTTTTTTNTQTEQ
ncbi:unnamed protein product, partial [Adineta ricciae]